MDLLILVFLFFSPLVVVSQPPSSVTSHITVTGSVFCDVCYNNSFTKQSYFLPGADVHVECKFQANAPKTREKITFSVNRTTNRYGVYRLDIPSVQGVDCVEGPAIQSFCEATLIRSSFKSCNLPSISSTSKEITVKSRSTNLCVYGLSALSYKPLNRNSTLCDIKEKLSSADSFNSSKFFLPYFPWPFPPFPSLPPLPQLPPFPSLPPWPSLPPLPQLPPFPFPPFQFPPLSPLPSLPPLPQLPPLPPFTYAPPQPSFQNPPTNFPPFTSPPVLNPPPNPLNPSDSRTWIPENPFPIPRPPQPPGFDLRDPRSWIPNFPPSPNSPRSQQP